MKLFPIYVLAKVPSGDDLALTQIANRLNDAAARNRPERNSSVERSVHNTSQEHIQVSSQAVPRSNTPPRPEVTNKSAPESSAVVTRPVCTPIAQNQATPIAHSEGSELIEAEIIDANTGKKLVMMVSPGQIAQLRAGTVEVPSDAAGQSSEHLVASVGSVPAGQHVSGNVQEQQKVTTAESVKPIPVDNTEKVTQQIRNRAGNIIGVHVIPKAAAKTNTTRKQLVHYSQPKKQFVGPVGAAPAYEVESGSLGSDMETYTGIQSSDSGQSMMVQRQSTETQGRALDGAGVPQQIKE